MLEISLKTQVFVRSMFVLICFLAYLTIAQQSFADSITFSSQSNWETGTTANISTDSTLDSIELEPKGTWGVRSWKTPDASFYLGASYTTDGTDIYALRGYGDVLFWKYETAKDRWITLTDAPRGAYYGADLLYLDGYVYAIFGAYQTAFARYSVENNSWEYLESAPDEIYEGGSITTNGTDIFLLRGNNSQDFYKYEVSSNSWLALAGTPHTVRRGSDMVYDDGYIFATRGSNNNRFYRYDIDANTWSEMATVPGTMYDETDITSDGDYIYATRGNNTTTFYRYSISGNSWTTLTDAPATIRYSGGTLYVPNEDLVYVFRSNNQYDFWKYDPDTAEFLGYSPLPTSYDTGADLIYHDGYVYAPRGNNNNLFYRLNLSSNSWESLSNTPQNFNDDTKGVRVGDNLYFFRGSNTTDFYRYSTTGDSWTTLSDAPSSVRFGGTLVYPGSGDYIYATRGNTQSTFWRYSISGDSWDDVAVSDLPTEARATYGARLISDGTDIFYIPAVGEKTLYKYTIGTDTWSELTTLPFSAYYGTDVTYYNGKLYALAGWYKNEVWAYTISTDTWKQVKSLSGYFEQDIGAYSGASIEADDSGNLYVIYGYDRTFFINLSIPAEDYAASGTWTSNTRDLGYVASFGSFTATATTESDSSILYQTNTSTDGSTWEGWQTVSGSTIQSTPNRYIKVRAILTVSTDGMTTPTISNITINYTPDETAPSNPDTITALSREIGGTTLTTGNSYKHTQPYFQWSGASDTETEVDGYYVYFGTNPSADPEVLGTYQTSNSYVVTKPLSTGTYYLRISTKDTAENVSSATDLFEYVYSGISPAQSESAATTLEFTGNTTDVSVASDQIKLAGISGGFWLEDIISNTPASMQYGARMMAYDETNGKLFVFRGNNSTTFYEYDIATDTWTSKSSAPASVRMGGGVVEGPDGYLFATRGNNTTTFWRYDIESNTWSDEDATDTPLTMYYGSSLVFDDDQYIYALRGYNDDAFWRYDTNFDTWETLATVNFGAASNEAVNNNVYHGGDLAIDSSNSLVYAIQGYLRDGFSVYDVNTNEWSVLPDVPSLPYLGASIEYDPNTEKVYYIPGYYKEHLYEYDVTTQTWTKKQDAPDDFYYGATLKRVENDLYVVRGGNSTSFYKYNIPKDTWNIPTRNIFGSNFRGSTYLTTYYGADILKGDGNNFYLTRGNWSDQFVRWNETTGEVTQLAPTPGGTYNGSALVYDSTQNKIYLTSNSYQQRFFEYDIATNTWTEMSSDPVPVATNYGASMVYDRSRYIYLNRGGNSRNFYRYDTQADAGERWDTMSLTPANVGYGAELTIEGDYIYTLRGQNVANNPLYRYDISGDTWDTLSPLSIDVYNDGFMTNAGDGTFYAARGENDTDFFKYTVATDTWETLDDTPDRIYAGGAGESNQNNKLYMLTGSGTNSYRDAIYTYIMETENSGFVESGRYESQTHDLTSVYKWANLDVVLSQPTTTGVTVYTRSSSDGSNWSSWNQASSEKQLGTTYSYKITSQANQYLQVAFDLTSSNGIASPTIQEYTIYFYKDDTAPTNPSTAGLSAYSDNTPGSPIVSGTWYNHSEPYFDWPEAEATNGASDTSSGSGVTGYYVYFGTDNSADPENDGSLQEDSSFLASGLSNGETYYLRIKTVDDAGNISADTWEPFVYKYDGTGSSKPTNVNADPSGYSAVNSFDFSWDEATSSGAPVEEYCYKTNADSGDYASDQCTSATSISNVPASVVGPNTFYVRTKDAADNYSEYTTASYYYVDSANAPAPPTNLSVTPPANTANSFAFSWDAPTAGTFYGSASNLSYRYSVNALPTAQSTTSTSLKELNAGAYATLPGENVFYIVSMDEAGNINYSNYTQISFEANTVAPGIPLNIDIADVSVKSTSSWKIALSWEAPETGGEASNYAIYRSVDGTNFTQVATSGGISYVDVGLIQQTYYYKVKACDSANNCGAFSDVVELYPDGKFTTPADLIGDPVVSNITTRKATVTWTTNRTSDSKIAYGTSSGDYFDEEISNSEQVTYHQLNLLNLEPGTTYYFVTRWTDEDGNTGQSEEMTFTTEPPPSTEEPNAKSIGLDNVLIEFTSKNASRARIYYGETSAFGGTLDIITGTGEGTHTAQIDELNDGTKYFYKINTFDSEGEEYEGEIHSFTTLPRPRVENITISQVKGTAKSTLLLTWQSNTSISSVVTYYPVTNPSLALDEINIALKEGRHQMVLHNLEPQTTYAILIKGKDAAGNEAVGELQQITTSSDTRPPQISDLTVESEIQGNGEEATAQLVVSYQTDEPATAQIEYGEGSGTSYSQKTQEDSTLTNNHMIVISELSPGKVYHLRAISKDSYGNQAYSLDKVVITPKASENALDLVVNNLTSTFGFLSR